jgi:hypothetical protein
VVDADDVALHAAVDVHVGPAVLSENYSAVEHGEDGNADHLFAEAADFRVAAGVAVVGEGCAVVIVKAGAGCVEIDEATVKSILVAVAADGEEGEEWLNAARHWYSVTRFILDRDFGDKFAIFIGDAVVRGLDSDNPAAQAVLERARIRFRIDSAQESQDD